MNDDHIDDPYGFFLDRVVEHRDEESEKEDRIRFEGSNYLFGEKVVGQP